MSKRDKIIDLPDIKFEGILQDGVLYYRAEDVHGWVRESAEIARDIGIPMGISGEVAVYVAGMADALKRARGKSGF